MFKNIKVKKEKDILGCFPFVLISKLTHQYVLTTDV